MSTIMLEQAYPELDYEFKQSRELMEKASHYEYAQKLYAALCNNYWKKESYAYNDQKPWAVSWRTAGGVTSELHHGTSRISDYMEFYCSGSEGYVDAEIEKDLYDLGWTYEPME